MKTLRIILAALALLPFSSEVFAVSAGDRARAAGEIQKGINSTREAPAEIAFRKEATGLEWLEMSYGERVDTLLYSMTLLSKHGVILGESPNDYCNAVETKLRADPGLYPTTVTNILATVVYEREPASRQTLDRFRVKKKET